MIHITTLGTLRVRRGEEALHDLPAQKLRCALLVYLASECDVSRDDVVAMFWADRDTARGRHALRQMLYELRAVLGDDWVELHRDRIICRIELDANAFEQAADAGRRTEALALYRGPFMAAFAVDVAAFEGWVERRRAHLARLHRRLQREQIAELANARDHEGAIAAARHWVEMDPLDDEAAQALIERLAAAGQRSAALQYFESYERQLRAELDVAPLDSTLELVAALRRGDAMGELPVAPPRSPAPVAGVTAPEVAVAPVARDPGRPPARLFGRLRPRYAVATAVVVLVGVIAAFNVTDRAAAGSRVPPTVSIAVYPFEDFSPDSSLGLLAQEFGAELADQLGRSNRLAVTSPDGIRHLENVRDLVMVDYIVRARLIREGDLLRLSLSLEDGRTHHLIESETIERTGSETRILMEDVVNAAASFLRAEVGSQLEFARARSTTRSEEAWQHVLLGRAESAQIVGPGLSLDARTNLAARADSIFARASALDPRWAEPVRLRAGALAIIASLLVSNDTARARAHAVRALALADEAIRLDPGSADAYFVRSKALGTLSRLAPIGSAEARRYGELQEASLRTATEMDPSHQMAHADLARTFSARAQWGEAWALANTGYRADPFSRSAKQHLMTMFRADFERGRDVEAQGWCSEGYRRYPGEPPYIDCMLVMNAVSDIVEPDPAEARKVIEAVPPGAVSHLPHMPRAWDAMLAATYARAGMADSARAALSRSGPPADDYTLTMQAVALYRLGGTQEALQLLRAHRRLLIPQMQRQRTLAPLRDLPGFGELFRESD